MTTDNSSDKKKAVKVVRTTPSPDEQNEVVEMIHITQRVLGQPYTVMLRGNPITLQRDFTEGEALDYLLTERKIALWQVN